MGHTILQQVKPAQLLFAQDTREEIFMRLGQLLLMAAGLSYFLVVELFTTLDGQISRNNSHT